MLLKGDALSQVKGTILYFFPFISESVALKLPNSIFEHLYHSVQSLPDFQLLKMIFNKTLLRQQQHEKVLLWVMKWSSLFIMCRETERVCTLKMRCNEFPSEADGVNSWSGSWRRWQSGCCVPKVMHSLSYGNVLIRVRVRCILTRTSATTRSKF